MFPYDPTLLAAVQSPLNSIADVFQTMQAIDSACIDGDGLKWFNWLYMCVTQAVEAKVNSGTFLDSAWIAELDVQFAKLYFSALEAALSAGSCPGCWKILFDCRGNGQIARIQFALAGINAHINHDLPEAIVATCNATNTVPQQGATQHTDYTNVNPILDGLISVAEQTLNVRLLGGQLPAVNHLADLFAAWSTSAAREKAWQNGEVLWHLQGLPAVATGFLDSLDGLTSFAGKALLAPVP